MLTKFYFLAYMNHYKLLTMVYFLHKCHLILQSYSFLKIFPRLTYLTCENSKLFFPCFYETLKTQPLPTFCSPASKTHEGGTRCRTMLHPVSSALNALLQVVIMVHPVTSVSVCVNVSLSETPAHHCYLRTLLFFLMPCITI